MSYPSPVPGKKYELPGLDPAKNYEVYGPAKDDDFKKHMEGLVDKPENNPYIGNISDEWEFVSFGNDSTAKVHAPAGYMQPAKSDRVFFPVTGKTSGHGWAKVVPSTTTGTTIKSDNVVWTPTYNVEGRQVVQLMVNTMDVQIHHLLVQAFAHFNDGRESNFPFFAQCHADCPSYQSLIFRRGTPPTDPSAAIPGNQIIEVILRLPDGTHALSHGETPEKNKNAVKPHGVISLEKEFVEDADKKEGKLLSITQKDKTVKSYKFKLLMNKSKNAGYTEANANNIVAALKQIVDEILVDKKDGETYIPFTLAQMWQMRETDKLQGDKTTVAPNGSWRVIEYNDHKDFYNQNAIFGTPLGDKDIVKSAQTELAKYFKKIHGNQTGDHKTTRISLLQADDTTAEVEVIDTSDWKDPYRYAMPVILKDKGAFALNNIVDRVRVYNEVLGDRNKRVFPSLRNFSLTGKDFVKAAKLQFHPLTSNRFRKKISYQILIGVCEFYRAWAPVYFNTKGSDPAKFFSTRISNPIFSGNRGFEMTVKGETSRFEPGFAAYIAGFKQLILSYLQDNYITPLMRASAGGSISPAEEANVDAYNAMGEWVLEKEIAGFNTANDFSAMHTKLVKSGTALSYMFDVTD